MRGRHMYVPAGLWCGHVYVEASDADPWGEVCSQPWAHPDHLVAGDG